MSDRLLTLDQAADLLGLSASAMYQMRGRGHGPTAIRLGTGPRGRLRYRESDLMAWVESRRDDPADRLAGVG